MFWNSTSFVVFKKSSAALEEFPWNSSCEDWVKLLTKCSKERKDCGKYLLLAAEKTFKRGSCSKKRNLSVQLASKILCCLWLLLVLLRTKLVQIIQLFFLTFSPWRLKLTRLYFPISITNKQSYTLPLQSLEKRPSLAQWGFLWSLNSLLQKNKQTSN